MSLTMSVCLFISNLIILHRGVKTLFINLKSYTLFHHHIWNQMSFRSLFSFSHLAETEF